MSQEPSYPNDAAVTAPAGGETLDVAASAKQSEQAAAATQAGTGNRSFIRGAAVGVGSAALVAALLYAGRSRWGDSGKK